MRITNKMMSNNSMSNINTNKEYLDHLNNQMATEKKITRPSDDPIIAIRALRLRSNLSEIGQYYGSNVPDAQAWVMVTQSAIESTKGMISSMKALCDQGANGTNTVSERQNIYQELQGLQKQIYANGNATDAGRTVFTGYRTGEKLTFTEGTSADYRGIWDSFNAADVKINTYLEGGITLDDINGLNPSNKNEIAVNEDRVNRIRLSYDNINTKVKETPYGQAGDEAATISGWGGSTDWTDYVEGGRLTKAGEGFSSEVTLYDTTKVTVTLDPKCNKALKWEPDPAIDPPVIEMSLDIETGKVYGTREYPNTTLVYRNALEQPASIDPARVTTDPVDGLQSFEIDYGGRTYKIEKDSLGRFVGKDTGNSSKQIMVTQNNDKSFTISVGDQDSYKDSTNFNVFNVSANGRTVTSYYAEHELDVEITTSDATVNAGKTAYQYLALAPDNTNTDTTAANKIYLLADTGELVFGSSVAQTLGGLKDIPGVDTISVKYDKSSFSEGDLRPEHYFDCKQVDDEHIALPIYAMNYDDHSQDINYTVGTNQSIKINTNAEEVFDTQIVRTIDDVLTAIDTYNQAEDKVNRLTKMRETPESYTDAQMVQIDLMYDAASKELDLAKNKLQSTYERAISECGQYFDQANLAETACGTVESRLELISNRLSEEKTTVTTLASDNENVDLTNIAVEVSEANLVYNAALMATGRISQQTLVDYI